MTVSSDSSGRVARELYIQNKRGLHLRLAGEIAKVAMRYNAAVKLVSGGQAADAKSALALLALAAVPGSRILVVGEGRDASEAVEFLADFISRQDREY